MEIHPKRLADGSMVQSRKDGARTWPRTLDGKHIATVGSALEAADLDAFVREHHGRLVGLARLVCVNSDDAGDAVQAALEQAWRQRHSLRDAQALRAWLDRIVVVKARLRDRTYLRTTIINPRTSENDLSALLMAIRAAASRPPAG